jgi:hypothetical protein
MEPYVMYLIAVLLGGICRVVIPYLLKVYQDPTIHFDMMYFYNLVVAMVLSVLVLIPAEIGPPDLRVLVTLFLAALGMTDATNKVVKSYKYNGG